MHCSLQGKANNPGGFLPPGVDFTGSLAPSNIFTAIISFILRTRQQSKRYRLKSKTRGRALTRRPATLHATVLFHSVAARQVLPKSRFFLFFSFSSRRLYSCLCTAARRFLCVLGVALDALHRCAAALRQRCVLDFRAPPCSIASSAPKF